MVENRMTQASAEMEAGNREAQWFAAHVRSNQERSVANLLEAKNLEAYVPVYGDARQWSDRMKQIERPLFPGYVFCRIAPGQRGPLQMTPGIVRIVGAGRRPVPIDDAEMEALRQVAASPLARQPYPFVAVGDTVEIRGGPLHGITGILERRKGGRKLIVGLTLLRRSVAVEFDDSWIALNKVSAGKSGAEPIAGSRR